MPKRPATTSSPQAGNPSPGAASPASPAAVATKLVKPADTARVLRGNLKLDASYVISSGGGGLRDGGIDARGGVAMPDEGNLIATAGQIIARDGQTLISNNGGNVIANNGGNLTSKVKRQLLADDQPAPGENLPVRGALVGLISLKDGKPVPVGVDGEGKPVYMVLANARGEFELYPPEDINGNLLVVASLPDNTDKRLAVETISHATSQANAALSETSTTLVEHLRETIANDLEQDVGYKGRIARGVIDSLGGAVPASVFEEYQATLLDPQVQKLSQPRLHRVLRHIADMAMDQVELDTIDIDPKLAMAAKSKATGKAMDVLAKSLATFDRAAADKFRLVPATPYPAGENYFTRQPYVEEANRGRSAELQFTVVRPSDVTALMVGAYMTTAKVAIKDGGGDQLIADLGLPQSLKADVSAATNSLFQAMHLAFFLKLDRAEVKRVVLEEAARELEQQQAGEPMPTPLPTATPRPAPSPTPAPVVERYAGEVTVSTLAADKITVPTRLGIDGAGELLVEGFGGEVYRVLPNGSTTQLPALRLWTAFAVTGLDMLYSFDTKGDLVKYGNLGDTKNTVSVVSRTADRGSRENTAGSLPTFDAAGNLYFTDVAASGDELRIWKIGTDNKALLLKSMPGEYGDIGALAINRLGEVVYANQNFYTLAAGGQAELLAGDGPGYVDGPAATARFGNIEAAIYDAKGNLIVADGSNHVIRMLQTDGKVVTLAGTKREDNLASRDVDGNGEQARFGNPQSLALAADGTLYVVAFSSQGVRKIVYR